MAEEELPNGVVVDYGDTFLWEFGGRESSGNHVTVSTQPKATLLVGRLDGKGKGPIVIDPDSGNWQKKD